MPPADPRTARRLVAAGAVNGFLAVALGAFGAHGLRGIVDASRLAVFETAVLYHGWHALALVATGLAAAHLGGRWLPVAGWLFLTGILLFSGSLYALTLGAPRWLGPVTPVGGIAFLAAWLTLAAAVWRSDAA
jgi:uncharacterized membrane protein YgdD (TMEM256/DUF423 family)